MNWLNRLKSKPSEALNPSLSSRSSSRERVVSRHTFHKPRNFVINNPSFTNVEQVPPDTCAMQWLEAHSISGVEYNSSLRAPPPRCYDGTRSALIAEIGDLLRHPSSEHKLICIFGPVGVGKSTIAQTLAEGEEEQNRLGATIFFPPSHMVEHPQSPNITPTNHGDDSRLWITISYRLATNDALTEYRNHVASQINKDLKLVEKSMEYQFEKLIAEPIGQKRLIRSQLSIWLDGLDQCCRKDLESQERIIYLITNFIRKYPSSSLVWIITSRPEPHLDRAFTRYKVLQAHIKRISILVESDDARRDVLYFLRGSFDDIQARYPTVRPLPWPGGDDFNTIHVAVSGLFLLASAIINFIGDRKIAHPKKQLTFTLSVLRSNPPNTNVRKNPLASVHKVYEQVLQSMPEDSYLAARKILGFLLLPKGFGVWARDFTPFWALCNILGIAEDEAHSCLNGLHSLVEIPDVGDTASPVRFFHNSSLTTYLANREYSGEFWIDTKEVVANLWQCHFRVLQEAQIGGNLAPQLSAIQLSWPSTPEDDSDFRNQVWENARRVFFHHLLPCPSNPCSFGLHFEGLSDFENSSRLIKVLEKICFHNLVNGYVFPDFPDRFVTFLDWVRGEGQDLLRRNNLLQPIDVSDQEYPWIDRNAISFRIQDEGGPAPAFTPYADCDLTQSVGDVDPDQLLSTKERAGSLAQLIVDLKTFNNRFSTAILLGPKDAKQCAILIATIVVDHKKGEVSYAYGGVAFILLERCSIRCEKS